MAHRVLCIDDEPQLPERADEILAQAGYALIHTNDPDEALRIACEESPSLVLVEVLLGSMNGFELIRRINRAEISPPLPIVVVTRGERTSELYGQAIELGVADFLCKPVVEAEILEAVLAFARQPAQDESETEASDRTGNSFEGSLEEQSFPQLLGRLHGAGSSGVLMLHRGSDTRSIQFRNGSPIEVERHGNDESIADFLRRTGRIDRVQYDMLVDQLMARISGPREILLGMDAISEAELAAATHEQAHGLLLDLFEWKAERFSFVSNQGIACSESLELACDPIKTLFAGLGRTSDAAIRAALDHRASLYVSYLEAVPHPLLQLEIEPDQRSKITSLIGDRMVAEVRADKVVEDRLLFGLYAAGIVLFDEIPVLNLDQELNLDEVVEIRALPRRAARPGELPSPTGAIHVLPSASEEIVYELDEIAARLDSGDDFEVFGIDESSRDADVRTAYDMLLKSLRQAEISNRDPEVADRSRAIRARLEQAYQRVRTADTRQAFAGLRKRKPAPRPEREDGSRAVDAESWFRTGEGHLRHEDYDQAIEAFGMAVHLDPDQGDYSAYLGYSLYRAQPENTVIRKEALEHVAKGVKLGPGREKPLLFLSRIFRETGDVKMSAKVLRRALEANPDSPTLVQEMCLVDGSSAKSRRTGLRSLFRRR